MRVRNAFILLASVPGSLVYAGISLEQELIADGIINWLRGGRSNFKTEGKFRRRESGIDSCSYPQASEAVTIYFFLKKIHELCINLFISFFLF